MINLLDKLFVIFGLEMGYLPDKLAKLIGLLFYHIFMLTITGGLWVLWLIYKYLIIKKELKERRHMTPYKDKMRAEYRDLKDKRDKLHTIISKHNAGTLDFKPTCPIYLLERQERAMDDYLHVLEMRAELEGVML